MEEKRIELTLSTNYVSHWTVLDALRELYQNAIDVQNENYANTIISDVTEDNGELCLKIGNRNVALSLNTLLLGETSKADNNKMIGKFGEGYKLAILVLLRHGCDVSIFTADEHWLCVIERSEVFDTDVLVIYVNKVSENYEKTVFEVQGVSEQTYDEYVARNLYLQEDYKKIETDNCEVLLDECNVNKVFVGGLFVCDYPNASQHGYNFKPGVFKLGRDRQVIDGFSLNYNASRALISAAAEDVEEMKKALDSLERDDMIYASSFLDSYHQLTKAAWKRFIEEYPDSIPVSDNSELREMTIKYQSVKCIMVSERMYGILTTSKEYKNALTELIYKPTRKNPLDLLQSFYDDFKDEMSAEMQQKYADTLLVEAIDWRLK